MPSEFVCPSRPALGPGGAVPGHSHYIPLLYPQGILSLLVWRFVFWFRVLGKTYTELFSAMRPRPWLLLCVSLHGVAATRDDFPSWKHGLDYCIAEASTHHRHDSVDRHGTSNNMWDAIASLAPYMPVSTNVAGMCEYNPIRAERCEQCIQSTSSSPFEPTVCFDNPFLEILSLKLQLGPEHLEDMCASNTNLQTEGNEIPYGYNRLIIAQ